MCCLQIGLVIMLNYACTSYVMFEDEIQEYWDCETGYQCVMMGLAGALRGDIGLQHGDHFGNVFQSFPMSVTSRQMKHAQWWFVTSFLLIWNYIFVGIVQGYIVDSFSMIREEQENRKNDCRDRCLVCSMHKFDFQTVEVHCMFISFCHFILS